ncbi:hypothetical protein GCM10020254_77990 [Streptomyces goshikiensis]
MRPRITEIAENLLRACAKSTPVDLMSSFAFPLPIAILCELMGIPEGDRPEILDHFRAVTLARFDPSRRAELEAAEAWLQARLGRLVAYTREHPSDCFVSDLVQAEEGLDDAELVASLWVIFFAGHKTTAYQIGNSVLDLLLHPDQLAKLRTDPLLIPGAVEEMVRFDGSVESSTFRYAAEEAEIRGTVIPKGVPRTDRAVLGEPGSREVRVSRRAGRDARGDPGHAPGVRTRHALLPGGPAGAAGTRSGALLSAAGIPEMELADPQEGRAAWLKGPMPAFRGLETLHIVLEPSRRAATGSPRRPARP